MNIIATIENDRTGETTRINLTLTAGQTVVEAIVASRKVGDYAWNLLDVERGQSDDAPLPPDPNFPDRPTHPDFARMSSAAIEQDAIADMLGLSEAASFDLESLAYIADARVHAALGAVDHLTHRTSLLMPVLYMDAFQLGVGFERRGGHRDAV